MRKRDNEKSNLRKWRNTQLMTAYLLLNIIRLAFFKNEFANLGDAISNLA